MSSGNYCELTKLVFEGSNPFKGTATNNVAFIEMK